QSLFRWLFLFWHVCTPCLTIALLDQTFPQHNSVHLLLVAIPLFFLWFVQLVVLKVFHLITLTKIELMTILKAMVLE
ncbi:MAG: hypothetical protein ACOVLD_08890, partial [Bacteroidia bacterium]